MSEIGFFPSPVYATGLNITFENPEHTGWIIIAKLSQHNSQKEEAGIQAGSGPSYALVTFLVRSNLDSQEAYMRVYLQVPTWELNSSHLMSEPNRPLLDIVVRLKL